ncbi:MAG: sortase domain-bontaining protein [Nitriliruptoraceae bacterium]
MGRGLGWTLLVAGAVVLLYVVYLQWFTGIETARAQDELREQWELAVPDRTQELTIEDRPQEQGEDEPDGEEEVEVVNALAALWFERDGEPILTDEVQYVVDGVSWEALKNGPGHYPLSDLPGGAGNVAIAGHRGPYGGPFYALDRLREGDTIHVIDREGREWVYAYREQVIVEPTDLWVVGDDPLGTGAPTITLTSCHPIGSDAERLIAFGELLGDPLPTMARSTDPVEIATTEIG